MSIEVIKIETGFAVKFPFELKDNFRSVFKTAKWNPIKKQWEVGPRSYKKLVEWTESVQEVDSALNLEKEIQENVADLFAAKAELSTIKDSIQARLNDCDPLDEILSKLETVQNEIEIAKEERKQAEKIVLEKRNQIRKFLSGVIDFALIEDMKSKMARMHRSVGDRGTFDSYQDKIRDELNKLKKVGFTSRGLVYLSSVNYNQPDRDGINKCPDILDIREFQEDE